MRKDNPLQMDLLQYLKEKTQKQIDTVNLPFYGETIRKIGNTEIIDYKLLENNTWLLVVEFTNIYFGNGISTFSLSDNKYRSLSIESLRLKKFLYKKIRVVYMFSERSFYMMKIFTNYNIGHPHVSGNSPCLADYKNELYSIQTLYQLFNLTKHFLSNHTPASEYSYRPEINSLFLQETNYINKWWEYYEDLFKNYISSNYFYIIEKYNLKLHDIGNLKKNIMLAEKIYTNYLNTPEKPSQLKSIKLLILDEIYKSNININVEELYSLKEKYFYSPQQVISPYIKRFILKKYLSNVDYLKLLRNFRRAKEELNEEEENYQKKERKKVVRSNDPVYLNNSTERNTPFTTLIQTRMVRTDSVGNTEHSEERDNRQPPDDFYEHMVEQARQGNVSN